MHNISAMISTCLAYFMAILHLLLIVQVPLGEYVLGGKNRVLPKEKRKISIFFFLVFIVIGTLYLKQTTYITFQFPNLLEKILMIVYTLFLAYAIIGNLLFSDSKKEKILMVPLSVLGFITSLLTYFTTK